MPRFMLWEIPKFFLLEAPSYLLNLLPLNLLPYNPLGRRRSAGGGNSTVVAAPGLYPAMQSPQPGEGDPRAPWYPSVSPPVWYSVDTSAPPRPMQDNATDTPFPWAIGLNEESKIPSLSEDFETEGRLWRVFNFIQLGVPIGITCAEIKLVVQRIWSRLSFESCHVPMNPLEIDNLSTITFA